ncbi:MAG: 16S rRNA (guanine(527)-N(7))-methyltransferase RsmG [Burkholderiales bacterium]
MNALTLADGLAQLNLSLPPATQQKLLDYVALVQKWNKVYNLTAVREAEKMLTHHLLDSLAVVPHVATAKTILDVGSGAGLPGIPLALALPDAHVTLLDSNHKKAAFLNQVVIELKLSNATVVCERVEKYQQKQLFNVVVSRAFSDLPEFVALAGGLVAPGGMLLAMKGVHPFEEIAQLKGAFQLSGVTPLAVPGLDAERHLVFLKAA